MGTLLRTVIRAGTYSVIRRLGLAKTIAVGVVALVSLWVLSGDALAAELDYQAISSSASVTANSGATANTIITSSSVAYDGATKVRIEFFSPKAEVINGSLLFTLYNGSTELGPIGTVKTATAGTTVGSPVTLVRYITPTAASHVYSVRAWTSGTSASVAAGTGSGGATANAYLRISSDPAPSGGASALADLTDVDLTGLSDNDILKYDSSDSAWEVSVDEEGAGGGGAGPGEALSEEQSNALTLVWYGVWAIVGLLLTLLIAPKFTNLLDPLRGL